MIPLSESAKAKMRSGGVISAFLVPANDNAPQPTYPDVIALAGPAGAGKSTAARYLIEHHGYTLVKFAGPLKSMLRALGLTNEHIEGSLKEVPSKLLCGKTPRWAMQSLGHEWGREQIGPNLWVNAWRDTVSDVLDQGGRVVVDDLRFANEEAAARQLGGRVIALFGRGGIDSNHASETYRPVADSRIWNGEGADLQGGLDMALEAWRDEREVA